MKVLDRVIEERVRKIVKIDNKQLGFMAGGAQQMLFSTYLAKYLAKLIRVKPTKYLRVFIDEDLALDGSGVKRLGFQTLDLKVEGLRPVCSVSDK